MDYKRLLLFLSISYLLYGGSPAFLVNVGYESPSLIAPAVISIFPDQPNKLYQFGVVGWTIFGKGEFKLQKNLSLGLSIDVTPQNSNGSNYRYADGKRDPHLNFQNSTTSIQFYTVAKYNRNKSSRIGVIYLKENVDGLSDEIKSIWKHYYTGISLQQSYKNVIYEDYFNNRWDGKKLSVSIQYFSGNHSFYKGFLRGGIGKKINTFQIMATGKAFFSKNLNIVNQFVAGGQWELEQLDFLPGAHYGEFRFDNGILGNLRIDYSLTPNFNFGIRSGFLMTPKISYTGYGIKLMTVLRGIVYHFGVGISGDSIQKSSLDRLIFSGGITFGFM